MTTKPPTHRRISVGAVTSPLTARGIGLVAFAALAIVAARLFGIGELDALAAPALVAVLYSLAWTATRRWDIEVQREIRPARVEAGHGALVVLSLHNRASTSTPVLTLRDPFDDGSRVSDLLVASIRPQRRLTGSYKLTPTGRGIFTVGPLTLEATDPLGLARRVRRTSAVSTFIVHPRVERLRPPRVAAGNGRSRVSAAPLPGRDNDEFSSLREYQPGDDIRRMHWPSTARTDTLMVREDQIERRGQFCVLFDTRRHLWSAPGFERATSVAASIAVAAADAGLPTRIVTTDGRDSGSGSGQAHRGRILDLLAGVGTPAASERPTGNEPSGLFATPLLPQGGTVAVVGSDRADLADMQRLACTGGRVEILTVLVERSSSGPPGGDPRAVPSAGRLVRVAPGKPLASSWDRIA